MNKLLSMCVAVSAFGAGIALVFMPMSGTVEARAESSVECRVVKVALDEGYSISRLEERRVCE